MSRVLGRTMVALTIDSMDCAKFKCPRRLSASKEFQKLWRPENTFTAVLADRCSEDYYAGRCER